MGRGNVPVAYLDTLIQLTSLAASPPQIVSPLQGLHAFA